MDIIEVAGPRFLAVITLLSPSHQVFAILVELHDAGIDVSVTDEERAIGQPCHKRRTIEVFVVLARLVWRADCLQQPLSVVCELEDGVPVIIDDPDVLLRIVRTFKNAVGTPEHLVPLAPVFDEVAVRIDDIDDV